MCRMADGRQGTRLALEPDAPRRVGGEDRRQDLDRDVAAELGVVGKGHLAHSALADQRAQLVGREAGADCGPLGSGGQIGRKDIHRRCGREVVAEQRVDLAQQRVVVAAFRRQERISLRRTPAASRVVQARDLLPAAVRHSPRVISRASHDFASFQSRVTVSDEISRTAAVSAMVRPPKNRSSTIFPDGRPTVSAGRQLHAGRARRTTPARVGAIPSVKEIRCCWPAPRFCTCRERANSMRIRRISVAAMARKWARSRH